METVTSRSGSASRVTLTVWVTPSGTVYEPCSKLISTGGSSSSTMWNVVSPKLPIDTRSGSGDPMSSLTLSSSSSTSSSVVMKVIVLTVSPALKVRLTAGQ